MRIHLLSLKTSGMKNIANPIEIGFYTKKTIGNFNPGEDRVRVLYGMNGAGKSAVMLSAWVAKSIFRDKNFLARCGWNLFSKIFNQEIGRFDIAFVFALYDEKSNLVEGVYRYSLALKEEDGECVIAKETLELLKEKSLSGEYEKIVETENGHLEIFAINDSGSVFSSVRAESLNLIRQTSFFSFFRDYVRKNNLGNLFKSPIPKKEEGLRAINAVMLFLTNLIVVVDKEDKHLEYARENKEWFRNIFEDKSGVRLKDFVASIDPSSVLSTRDIVPLNGMREYNQYIRKLTAFLRCFKPNLQKIELDKKENGLNYLIDKICVYDDCKIAMDLESTGVKKLAELFWCLMCAANGRVVFVDELDANISGSYLRLLTEYMNTFGEGQLFFTAHSLDPMHVLADHTKSIYFIGEGNLVTPWIKNAHYKPYNLYPDGLIPGIDSHLEPADLVSLFSGTEK